MYRYITFVFDPSNDAAAETADRLASLSLMANKEWSIGYRDEGIIVVHFDPHAGCNVYRLADGGGVILGNLFRNSSPVEKTATVSNLDPSASHSICSSSGRSLLSRYWGRYIAVLKSEGEQVCHVIRDPSGGLPCHHLLYHGVHVVFAFIEDCISFPNLAVETDDSFIVGTLLKLTFHNGNTGLRGVSEILPGYRWSLSGSAKEAEALWNPIDVMLARSIEDPVDAGKALRSAVQTAISGWASCHESILHLLSGGLDSSIVAGCLGELSIRPKVTCLNHFTMIGADDEVYRTSDDLGKNSSLIRRYAGNADERRFARQTAARWGFALAERERIVADVDLARLCEAPLTVRPSGFAYGIDIDDMEREVGLEVGARAIWSGHAGDGLFFAAPLSLPAADYVHAHGFGRDFMRTAWDAAVLSGDSIWSVFGIALKYGLFKRVRPLYSHLHDDKNLLSQEALEHITDAYMAYPWPEPLDRVPPSKRIQVESYANCLNPKHYYPVARHFDLIDPLFSQPIMEVCLQIPTYTLVNGGVSRGLARRAFSNQLVSEVRQRQVKGAGTPFFQRLVRDNMPFLREALLDGMLMANGLFDRKKLDEFLVEDQTFVGVRPNQILNYIAVEYWMRSWSEASQRAAA